MPRSKTKKAEGQTEKNVSPTTDVVHNVTESTRSRKKKVEVPDPVVVPESVAETVDDSSDSTKKSRHVPTRDSVEEECKELMKVLDDEVSRIRGSASKSKGVKFLRTVKKRVTNLCTHVLRLTKRGKNGKRKANSNTNSGFLKPVHISQDLAKFTGWNATEERSRVDVTKYICKYIKDNNLQNPEDRREIRIDNDPKLKKLLGFDGKKDDKPLTYYSLQTYLKSHFLPVSDKAVENPSVVASTVVPPVESESLLPHKERSRQTKQKVQK